MLLLNSRAKPLSTAEPLLSKLRWNLDVAGVMDWAQRRELPGVGVADLLDYRREHPEEDLAAGLSSILSDGS